MVILVFLMLSHFMNEIHLNRFFLTEEMLYKDPFPLFEYNKLKPTSEVLWTFKHVRTLSSWILLDEVMYLLLL